MNALCTAAVDALEHALTERPDQIYDDMVKVVRCLVSLRDDLIGRCRDGTAPPEARDLLNRTNAILSLVVGGEYPLVGVRRERIELARDAVKSLLEDTRARS